MIKHLHLWALIFSMSCHENWEEFSKCNFFCVLKFAFQLQFVFRIFPIHEPIVKLYCQTLSLLIVISYRYPSPFSTRIVVVQLVSVSSLLYFYWFEFHHTPPFCVWPPQKLIYESLPYFSIVSWEKYKFFFIFVWIIAFFFLWLFIIAIKKGV